MRLPDIFRSRALLAFIALCPAARAAQNLDLSNASDIRFGAKFKTESGKPVAFFSGGGYLHPENGFSVPVRIADTGELTVAALVRAPKGEVATLEFKLGNRSLTKDFTGTGDFQTVEIGSTEVSRRGLIYPVFNARKGKDVACAGFTLSGKAGDTAQSVPYVPFRVVYVSGDADRGDRRVTLNAPGAEMRLPLVFGRAGELGLSLNARVEKDKSAKLRVTVGDASQVVEIKGGERGEGVVVPALRIAGAGTQLVAFKLESGDAVTLSGATLSGYTVNEATPLAVGNAQSVHFGYPVPKGHTAQWVYMEAFAEPGPPTTYNMAIGFHGGYFGFQRKTRGTKDSDRCFIYSVWDNGYVKNKDKGKLDAPYADKDVSVRLLAKGDDVVASAFDHEGSGGHSHWDHYWHDGARQKFLLGVRRDGAGAIYDAYVFADDAKDWKLMASFRRPGEKAELKGLYSFVEDWSGNAGDEKRACHYANIWIRDDKGEWLPVTTATGSRTHDAGREDFDHYLDKDGSIVLSSGGYGADHDSEGKPITIPTPAKAPEIDFAKLPKGK